MNFKRACLFCCAVATVGCNSDSSTELNQKSDFNLYSSSYGLTASVCAEAVGEPASFTVELGGVVSRTSCVSVTFSAPGTYQATATGVFSNESLVKKLSVTVSEDQIPFMERKAPKFDDDGSSSGDSSDVNAAEKAKQAEEQKRLEEERKAAEDQKRLEEERKAAEEQKRLEEERKVAEEQKRLEEERKAAEEQKRLEEERKVAEEQKRLEENQVANSPEGETSQKDTVDETATGEKPSPEQVVPGDEKKSEEVDPAADKPANQEQVAPASEEKPADQEEKPAAPEEKPAAQEENNQADDSGSFDLNDLSW